MRENTSDTSAGEGNVELNPAKKSRANLLLTTLASLFLTSVAVGYYVGRARSVNYDDPTRSPPFILRYVASRATTSPSRGWVESDDIGLETLRPALAYSFACGTTTFSFDEQQHKLDERPYIDTAERNDPPPRNNLVFSDAMALFVGGASAYSLKETGGRISTAYNETEPKAKGGFIVALISASAIGVGVGFWLGYNDQPQCGADLFQKLLKSATFWDGVAKFYVAHNPQRAWNFERKDGLILVRSSELRSKPDTSIKRCEPTILSVFDKSCDKFEADRSSWFLQSSKEEFRNIARWQKDGYYNCVSRENEPVLDRDIFLYGRTCTLTRAPDHLRHDLELASETALLNAIDKQAGRQTTVFRDVFSDAVGNQ